MRNSLYLALFIIFFFFLNLNVSAVEPLVKYKIEYQKDAAGNRIPDKSTSITPYRNVGLSVLNPNSVMIGDREDCYPDDLSNPEGNILISGSVMSKDTNTPITGAVVAVYMGSEHTNNLTDNLGSPQRFVVGEGERLSNLYYYDITKDGKYTIYACNDYKKLSEDKIKRYGKNFCVDGYTKTGDRCTHFDFTKAYPKFYVAVICGMSGFEPQARTNNLDNYRKDMENAKLKPWIGEILSIDNFNEPYKGANRPDFLSRKDFTIKVNCSPTLAPFPVPMFLEYTSNNNVASCRMDDVSPDLVNYFKKVQEPLRSSNYSLANSLVQGSTKIPSLNSLADCADPNDPLCAKNFITKAFPAPDKQKNLYNYGNKAYLEDSASTVNANPVLRNEVFSYNTSRGLNSRKIDFENGNSPGGRDYLAKTRSSSEGQVDAKLDAKTMIDDVKFDINSLKDLYACFTTFNFPLNRSSADLDEKQFSEANPALSKYYTPNLRVPSCRELYCGGKYLPENEICKVPVINEKNGTDNTQDPKKRFNQINTLTGYGPGVTMTLKSKKDITLELMKLVNELISSDFNPKKPLPGVKYKPVTKVEDIIGCYADDGKPVLLNSDGSITYQSKLGPRNFFSPVPMISFLSIPYNIEFLHAISNDNYANKTGNTSFFSEECNYSNLTSATSKDKNFANCRSAVIPGGVYSISALRVIAKMCTDNTKLPTVNNGVYSNKIETSKVEDNFGRVQPNEKRVELAVTRIGTPSSLCLCDPNSPTPGCNLTTKLNSAEKPQNYGVASFVGNNDQNKGNNFLGSLCNMTKKDSKDSSCSEFFSNRGDLNVSGTPNYIGGMNNLAVAWTYSYNDMDANFLTDKFFHHVTEPGSNIPQTNQGALPSLNVVPFISTVNGTRNVGSYESDKACLELYESGDDIPSGKSVGDCKSYAYFKQEVAEQNISSMEKDFDIPEPSATETPTVGLNEVAPDPVTGKPYLKNIGFANLYQKTKDGTSGYVYTKFDYFNQKYDPIPDLLNDFRRYTTWGIVPGGNAVCRTPKLATLVDFKTTEMTNFSRKDADEGGLDLNFAISRGALCNEVIPEELDRCETGEDITADDNKRNHNYTPQEECKLRKCLTLCNQLYPTYEFYSSRSEYFNQLIESATSPALTVSVPTDPATGKPVPHYQRKGVNERVYFCKNSDPKAKNVALEMNKGDEGCVLDYSRKIRDIYTLPKVLDEVKYKDDPLYAKFNYPVYNNQLCINPIDQLNFSGRSRDNLVNDSKNCKPFIGPQRPQDF
jgi:hypothetical protein